MIPAKLVVKKHSTTNNVDLILFGGAKGKGNRILFVRSSGTPTSIREAYLQIERWCKCNNYYIVNRKEFDNG